MDALQAVVYGLVQGVTEYLPVSSTAHLAMVPFLTGWPPPSFAFDVVVQLGTLAAVCLYLRDELVRLGRAAWRVLTFTVRGQFASLRTDVDVRLLFHLVVATLPAVVFGLLFKRAVEAQMSSVDAIFAQLFINGVLLIVADWLARRRAAPAQLTTARALALGFAQALAILPSISRSGSTIACALLVGLPRAQAGRFSFLMSVPVLIGAGLVGGKDLLADPDGLQTEGASLALATAVAVLVGFVVIRWFLAFVSKNSLAWFGAYCCVIAPLAWLWLSVD